MTFILRRYIQKPCPPGGKSTKSLTLALQVLLSQDLNGCKTWQNGYPNTKRGCASGAFLGVVSGLTTPHAPTNFFFFSGTTRANPAQASQVAASGSKSRRGAGVAQPPPPQNVLDQEEIDIEPPAGGSDADKSGAEGHSEKRVRRSGKAPAARAGPPVAKSLLELHINNPQDHIIKEKKLDINFFFDRTTPTRAYIYMECM